MSANVIDATCAHEMCEHNGTYTTEAECHNCGWEGRMVHTQGHRTLDSRNEECPRCGCREIHAGAYLSSASEAA